MFKDGKFNFEVAATEQPFPGITLEWDRNRQIVVYRLAAMTERIADQWAETVLEIIKQWDKSQPYLALHDLSAAGVSLLYSSLTNFNILNIGIVPHKKLMAEDIFVQHPFFRARVAVNFNISFSGRVGKFLTSTLIDGHPSVGYKTFYSEDKALQWLAQMISPSDHGDTVSNAK